MSEPDHRARFFYVHLQKTAGTSLIRRMRPNFGPRAVYPLPTDGEKIARVISIDGLLEAWARRGDEIELVTGHFPLCTAELLGAEFTTLTVLRHPLERTVSYLRHHRRRTPADRALTLQQVYDDDFRFNALVHNHMTKMLSLGVEEMDAGALTRVEFTRDRLERAMERLESVDAIGIQEDFGAFCEQLRARFGWTLDDPISRPERPAPQLSPGFRARILEDNAYDLELYEFARELVASRARTVE